MDYVNVNVNGNVNAVVNVCVSVAAPRRGCFGVLFMVCRMHTARVE